LHRQAYIGVESSRWITLFGPPSTLSKLLAESPEISDATTINLPAYGAVHGSHLPMVDVETILGSSPILDLSVSSRHRIISTSTCKPFESSCLRDLLRQIIPDIFQNIINLTGTVDTVISDLSNKDDITLRVMGLTTHAAVVQQELEARKKTFTIMDNSSPPAPQNLRAGSDLIAIVGMSGRFPGGDSMSQLWETLLKAEDLSQEVSNFPPSE
jgi:hypothetical protein